MFPGSKNERRNQTQNHRALGGCLHILSPQDGNVKEEMCTIVYYLKSNKTKSTTQLSEGYRDVWSV
jgi:hypothetical protein